MDFYFQLASLLIIIIYALLVFRNVDPLIATLCGVVLGFLFNWSNPLQIGKVLEASLSSFLAVVGFIIMLGRGLGEVLSRTRVSHNLVYRIVYTIGINTQKRVKIGIIAASFVIVAVLGTLAGGLAILAPILRPIAAKVGLSKPSLAVLMQAAGEEALIIGPFAPPVVALLGVTNLNYFTMLITASLPIALVTFIVTWFMANRLQQKYSHELFEVDLKEQELIQPSLRENITSISFMVLFISLVIYGLFFKAGTSYVIFVMGVLALLTGVIGGLGLTQTISLVLEGMKKNFHLFIIFILLDPFLNLIQQVGGFDALSHLFKPLEPFGGKGLLAILIGFTGAFGMPGASAAVIKMLHEIFLPSVINAQLSISTFAFSMLLATRITNYAYPGANMFAAMGFAESTNVKAMIKNGLVVAGVQVGFLVIYALAWS